MNEENLRFLKQKFDFTNGNAVLSMLGGKYMNVNLWKFNTKLYEMDVILQ